ncbi:alkylhydroperoxidase [Streptomyces sp. WAC04770]|nr:carboxymuconolactone decarboxylase family protein [Streptomyces sp. WAC04770]RST23213.1 alkylhydroperoxidase [Streptomyces sp. WAC04770]
MPHIALTNDLPGIIGLMAHRPDTGGPLGDLANALLRAPSSLAPGERELIAAYVSRLNGTEFCASSHGAFAAAQLTDGQVVVRDVLADPATAPVSGRLRALLAVAAEVRSAARPVSDKAIAAARAEGADDTDLHDTVLIAAAFCMYNRYVSCLSTELPRGEEYYEQATRQILAHGYRAGLVEGG